MSMKSTVNLSIVGLLLAGFLSLSPALKAAGTQNDSREVSALLSQAETHAFQLKAEASQLEADVRLGMRSDLSWETHVAKITEIKEELNKVAQTVGKLNGSRGTASPWQQQAIDRINPVLRELAANIQSTINHLKEHQQEITSCVQTDPEYKDHVTALSELATRMASEIANSVESGEAKTKL